MSKKIASVSNASNGLDPFQEEIKFTLTSADADNPIIQRALKKLKDSQVVEAHAAHHTHHSSHSTHSKGHW